MIDINWKVFEIKNPKATEAFENLCYFLFCRRYGFKEGVRTDFNQVGLETEPVKDSEGNYCGFQSKFFTKRISYNDIADSIRKARENYPELKHVIIYLNQSARTSCKNAENIVDKCKEKGIDVEWFTQEQFKVALNQPENLDLAEFYFGKTDVLNMLSDSKNLRINTLLKSKEYVELSLQNKNSMLTISEYCNEILKSDSKLHLFTGAAGTGKSVCMRKIFNVYGAFDKETKDDQLAAIKALDAICIFINLNNTNLNSLENIITAYKDVYYAESPNNKFIYLMDGLDEIPSSSLDSTLLHIESLLEKDTTKKIVISSRFSSNNKFILKATFTNVLEYTIVDLNKEQIKQYFDNKEDAEKADKLKEFYKENSNWGQNITDILTLSLLWKHIYSVNSDSVFTDLMELSISTILNDIHHKKYLEDLNLPNPKAESIIQINKGLAFYLLENDRFSFTSEELQEVINNIYPKCDYKSTNKIVSYLADVFFDVVETENTKTFSYQHRRFLEYFTILCIDKKMQEDLGYLRENNIIINKDLFENMLLPYLQRKAMRSNDISLAFEVGLFNVYLGKDKAWGVDNSFYYWSRQIIYSIAALPEDVLQKVIYDKGLPIWNFFYEMPEKIIRILSESEKISYRDDFKQYYINFVLLIVLIHRSGKKEILPELLEKYELIEELSREKKYYFNTTSNKDNYLVWRCILYIKTVIYNNDLDSRIDSFINNIKEVDINDLFGQRISEKTLCLSSLFYNLIIYYPEKCADIISKMSINQISSFVLAVVNPECLDIIIKQVEVINTLKVILKEEIKNKGLSSVLCISLKKIWGETITENEKNTVVEYLNSDSFDSHSIFWKQHFDIVGFIIMAFKPEVNLQGIDIAVIQYVNVYDAYFNLLQDKYTITKFVKRIQQNSYGNSEATYYIRILLGKALAVCNDDDELIKSTIDYLNSALTDGGHIIVYHTMKTHNPDRFNKIINSTLVNKLDNPNIYQDIDYVSTSDLLFMISYIGSDCDKLLSYKFLLKGLSNGIMRMNEGKDTIGDYKLLEGLKEILHNNWVSTERLKTYLNRIILIAKTMNSFHISNDVHGKTMELLQRYDFDAAEYYYDNIKSLPETYNDIHFNFAMGLVRRGRVVDSVERCLSYIKVSVDRNYQKLEWNSLYFKVAVYLEIASCDFYSDEVQDNYFDKAREEIDKLENAGWDRELQEREYEIYDVLCKVRKKEVDVSKAKEYIYTKKCESDINDENNLLDIIEQIDSGDRLNSFISKLDREYYLNNLNINEQLIQKCIEITGNIDGIICHLLDKHYPSSIHYSGNSGYFWMTVVAALKNPKSRNSIFEYLITSGGGHDGFSELIKIYAALDNKKVCVNAFESLLNTVEFLLC